MRYILICLLLESCGGEPPDFITHRGFEVWRTSKGFSVDDQDIDYWYSSLVREVYGEDTHDYLPRLRIYFFDEEDWPHEVAEDDKVTDHLMGYYSMFGWIHVLYREEQCAPGIWLVHEFGHYLAHIEYGEWDVDPEHRHPIIWKATMTVVQEICRI